MEEQNMLGLIQGASESGFADLDLVPEGLYRLTLDANATKNGQGVFVKGKIESGPEAGKTISCGSLTFNEKATGIAIQNLKGMGIPKTKIEEIAAANPGGSEFTKVIASFIKGRVVDAEIVYNTYKGETRNQLAIGKLVLVAAPPEPPLAVGIPQSAPPPVPVAAAPAPAAQVAAPEAAAVLPAPAPVSAPAPAAVPQVVAAPGGAPVAAPPAAPVAVAAPVAAPAAAGDPGF